MTGGGAPSGARPDWLHSAVVEALLPSGQGVRLERPSLRHLIRYGVLPPHLLEAAVSAADPEWLTEPEQADERQARVGEYLSTLVAWALRETCDPDGEWQPVRVRPEDVPGIDRMDRDALEDLVLRVRTPAEVTATSRDRLGLSAEDEPDEEVAIPGWADFRGQPGGAAAGDDGEPLGADPEPVAAAG